MRLPCAALLPAFMLLSIAPAFTRTPGQDRGGAAQERGQRLEDLTWPEAERLLTPDAVVVVPLGAASKEHGPHLKLRNDLTLAEYLTHRVMDASSVVVAPTLTYHYYPAFVEYPGSTTLTLESARGLTVDAIKSLAQYGPRRFYVLNTGVSTSRALEPAAQALAGEGVLVRHTNLNARLDAAARGIVEQHGGSHADEIETSMMLFIDPASVDMSKAVKEYVPGTSGVRLTRQRGGKGAYSASGVWGDPTLATRDKGRVFVEGLVAGIIDDISQLRAAPLPTAATAAATDKPAAAPAPRPATPADPLAEPGRCSAGDERSIRLIGDFFTSYWNNRDARRLSELWSEHEGDIVHGDGTIERGHTIIRQNREALFARREYRQSRHSLVLNRIRCLTSDLAVADGKWDLRNVVDTTGKPVPPMEGQASVVVKRYLAPPMPGMTVPSSWKIEAYRYTVKTATEQIPTAPPKRPGI
jgi:creatinine amidohydrolase